MKISKQGKLLKEHLFKLIAGVALVVMLTVANISYADSDSNLIAVGDVWQRTGAGMKYGTVDVLYTGSVVKGELLENGWVKYKVNNREVYSWGEYFEKTSNEVKITSTIAQPVAKSNYSAPKQSNTQVNQKVSNNSQNKPQALVSRNSGKEYYMTATAYSRHEAGLSNKTASGVDLSQNSRVIAVDPKVIPLGTRVYVEGYGEAIAADTGGAIKGNKIDVHLESVSGCYKWGRKHNVKVTILD